MSGEGLPQIGDWSSFDELRSLQDARIPGVLDRAARSPFYARRFAVGGRPVGVEDFARIPLTTKLDLQESYPFGMLGVSRSELATYFESSGTTGVPAPAYYTESDWRDQVERFARKHTGIHPSDIVLVHTPYALGQVARLAHEAGRFCGATIVPGDANSLVIPFTRVVRVLHDLGVTLTCSNPTQCLLWAATARRAGLDPARDFPALRGFFVVGEPLSVARRRRISEIWGGVPVVDDYGCSELGSLAGRCPAGSFHLWADRVKPEIYDAHNGTLTASGVGELVLTPLYLEAMPLVRYNLHDRVRLSYEDCDCGWKLPTITVLGRAGQGYPVAGSQITQLELEELVFSLPAELGVLFWRAKAEPDRLHIQIETDDASARSAETALRAAIDDALGVPCDIDVLAPGELVPDNVLTNPRQSLKPRPLFGPDESWDQAIVFSAP
jgi:phenylacetate-CoA ligase